MTAFCVSSTSRSRPVAFMVCAARGADDEFESVPEPARANLMVDIPEDEPADRPPAHDPGASPRAPGKHPAEQEHRDA